MCEDCEEEDAILPSIESFQTRLKNPKVNYIFYEYFFKAVIGEARWKRNFEENKRFGTCIAEAFTHALLENNYFAWLFDYKCKNPGCSLKTEYDKRVMEGGDGDDTNDDDADVDIFCGDLAGVEIALPENDGDEYKCLLEDSSQAYEDAREAAREIQKDVMMEVV